jgi:excisionase family DNA binding protein
MERLLRADQAAKVLNISTRSVYRLAGEGHFVCLKVGGSLRITEQSVNKYINSQIQKFYLDGNFKDNLAI